MAVGFDDHEEEPVFKLSPIVGNFYLTRPEGDPDTWAEYQFWVVEVKALDVMPDGHPGVRVQYWEFKKAKKKRSAPQTCRPGVRAQVCQDTRGQAGHDLRGVLRGPLPHEVGLREH